MGRQVPLQEAVEHAYNALMDRVIDGELAGNSAEAYGRRLGAFAAYARAVGVKSTAEVDERLIRSWINSPLSAVSPGSRGRAGGPPADPTRRARQALMRIAVRIWASQGWVDPTVMPVEVIGRTPSRPPCPLTPAEARRLRRAGQQSPADTLLPALVALGMNGLNHTEIARLALDSYDDQTGAVTVTGRGGRTTRTVELDAEARRAVKAHVRALSRVKSLKERILDPSRCPLALPTAPRTHRSQVTATAVGQHLYRALEVGGITRDGVTPGSLQEYAANACYAHTNRVEDVAELMGFASLDAAMRLIDRTWQMSHAAAVRGQQD